METKVYKVRDKFEYSQLKQYGFRKIEPKGNPWWQLFLNTKWEYGIEVSDVRINFNEHTHKCHVICEINEWSESCKEKIQTLINDNIIGKEPIEEIEE